MSVWNYLPVRNLLDLQRMALVKQMQDECRRLLADGYAVEADRVLDELTERKRAWARCDDRED